MNTISFMRARVPSFARYLAIGERVSHRLNRNLTGTLACINVLEAEPFDGSNDTVDVRWDNGERATLPARLLSRA